MHETTCVHIINCFSLKENMASRCILATAEAVVKMGAVQADRGGIRKCGLKTIKRVNKHGPYVGVVVPNSFEMSPLLQSSSFVPHPTLPYLEFSGINFDV